MFDRNSLVQKLQVYRTVWVNNAVSVNPILVFGRS